MGKRQTSAEDFFHYCEHTEIIKQSTVGAVVNVFRFKVDKIKSELTNKDTRRSIQLDSFSFNADRTYIILKYYNRDIKDCIKFEVYINIIKYHWTYRQLLRYE